MLNCYHKGKLLFFEQLMSNNSRTQQLKTVTIWWQLHNSMAPEFFWRRVFAIHYKTDQKQLCGQKRLMMWKITEGETGNKGAHSKYGKRLSQLHKGVSWLSESIPTMMGPCREHHCAVCCVGLPRCPPLVTVGYPG